MKLLTKTILYFILVSVPLLVAVGVYGFMRINDAVNENVNENLWNEKEKAEKVIDGFIAPQNLSLSFDSSSTIKIDNGNNKGYQFSERIRMDAEDGEQVKYKTLKSYYKKDTTNYLITITRPAMEEDDLIENLVNILLLILGTLVLAFLLVNLFLSQQLWKPFNKTLQALNGFELSSLTSFNPGKTKTLEFKKLNDALMKMTDKMQKDYCLQKEFTENASHEMQTPLAVIKTKVEQLMQSPQLKQEEMQLLQTIETSINKLSSLNKSLLLLAKIENQQYKEVQDIKVKDGLSKVLAIWDDFIHEKGITVQLTGESSVNLKMHPALFDILFTNLIQNAVRHNTHGGNITITIASGTISVANTGKPLNMDAKDVFLRFKKDESSSESTGLGLAIAKSIADSYNYDISYNYSENMHIFKLAF